MAKPSRCAAFAADGSKLLSHPLVVIQKRRRYMDEVEVFRQFERSFVILRDKGDRFIETEVPGRTDGASKQLFACLLFLPVAGVPSDKIAILYGTRLSLPVRGTEFALAIQGATKRCPWPPTLRKGSPVERCGKYG
jgi:hypothetical protein